MKIELDFSESELKLVLGVYLDLTQPTLLSPCLKGRTQIKNEFFHSKLLKRCLKTKLHGAQTAMFAFHMSVLEHNKGYIDSSLHHEIFGGISESGTEVKLQKKRLQKSMGISLPRRKRSKISQDEKVEGYGGGNFWGNVEWPPNASTFTIYFFRLQRKQWLFYVPNKILKKMLYVQKNCRINISMWNLHSKSLNAIFSKCCFL